MEESRNSITPYEGVSAPELPMEVTVKNHMR